MPTQGPRWPCSDHRLLNIPCPQGYIYAIPYEYYEKDDVRRYGFSMAPSHR